MRDTLIHTTLDALKEPHRFGHRCDDGNWWNPNAGTRTPCPVFTRLDTVRAQVEQISGAVAAAAEDPTTLRVMIEAMTGLDLKALPAEESEGWMVSAAVALEALAAHLNRDPAVEARAEAVKVRLAQR